MRRDEVLEKLRTHYAEIEQMGVKSLYLFGSTARDEAKATSDVDLLVDFQDPITLKKYANLYYFLEELLGHPIDLVTEEAVHERIRPYIEKDAIHVS
jgi:predicted nucleotidyltransferase